MLDIFKNEELNKIANDYFLMFFNQVDVSIELDGYKSAFMDIFPKHLVIAEMKKCKKIYNEIYSWIIDEFLHNSFRPIHEYVLYRMLEIQSEIESEGGLIEEHTLEEKEELRSLGINLSEEEKEYLKNINDAYFYLDFLFEDNDFLYYKIFYDSFDTERFNIMGYDERIIELLPKDKRKELKRRRKNKERNSSSDE